MTQPTVPPTHVLVELIGGTFEGGQTQAPRDDAGRILNQIWVRVVDRDGGLTAGAAAGEDDAELYELASWRGVHPVYRWVPADSESDDRPGPAPAPSVG